MSGDPKKPRGTPSTPKKGGGQAKDRWLKNQLRQLYDEVAAEPLPQDFLDLIEKFDPDSPPGGKSS